MSASPNGSEPEVVVQVSVRLPPELSPPDGTTLSREITATTSNVRAASVDLIDEILQEAVLDVRDQLSRAQDPDLGSGAESELAEAAEESGE